MASDAAMLSLIADDDESLRVLAAWASLGSDPDHEEVGALARVSPSRVPGCMARIVAARAMTDDGISDLADRLLQTRVMASLKGKR